MNLLNCLPLLAMCVCPLAAAQSTVRVDLNGSIQAGTCTAAAVSKTIPAVGANVFPQVAGNTGSAPASYTDFEIALTGCSGVTGATFQMGAVADASTQANVFRNKATNGAPFTGYWIKEGTGRCTAGATVAPGASITKNFTTATYQLYLCAQYVKIAGGLVTMGPLSTNFTVTITYR
ncbi:fimbrial protein [Stenotrophomonas nematodicola]|uniref:Fimbrial protein n=1 Tax=Stenotrophomonas nematodicola TaxID=2656746 RepID=A0ABW7CUM3_9GAMM